MGETLTTRIPAELGDRPTSNQTPRMDCENLSLAVKVGGVIMLASVALGASGDPTTALFVGVGYATTLACVAVLPVDRIATVRLRVRSRTGHR
jgi:hypothetical protein